MANLAIDMKGTITLGSQTVEYFAHVYGREQDGYYAEMRLRIPPPTLHNKTTTEVVVCMADETFKTVADAREWCLYQMKDTTGLVCYAKPEAR